MIVGLRDPCDWFVFCLSQDFMMYRRELAWGKQGTLVVERGNRGELLLTK